MPFAQTEHVEYYSFDIISDKQVVNAVFTRNGGVSPAPWAALNMGGTVGDDPQRVAINRQRAIKAIDRAERSVFDVWQVHSKDIVCATSPRQANTAHQKADAILTDRPEVTLFMRFADCVPIFLHDPYRKVVGLVHAGWKGTVNKIVAGAVQTMKQHYRSKPGDIIAAIGPSIGPDHYPIGQDVISWVESAFGVEAQSMLIKQGYEIKFDLWKANEYLLNESGVKNIEVAGFCTVCHLNQWYSHRAENGNTGRFGAFIGLRG